MKINVLSAPDAQSMAEKLADMPSSFVSIHANCALGPEAFRDLPPAHPVHGATSCLGAMTDEGVHDGIAAFVLHDPDGGYGTAMRPYDGDPRRAAMQAAKDALTAADRIGERPELVWLAATPGCEEDIIAGIEDVLGADVPIIGGSAADNSVEGHWFVFDGKNNTSEGVVVSVLFPSRPVSFAYQNGYSPSPQTGTVTKADGRTVLEIDGKPAMDVYQDWTGEAVALAPDGTDAQMILSDSTLWPLGRKMSEVANVPHYLLAHPAVGKTNGEIDLFATVQEGESLTQMTGTIQSLTSRAGRVAALARETGPATRDGIAGALMIYCGGCMLTVRDDLDVVVNGVGHALGGAPFLGAFTFGEQGAMLGAGNRHGNLMISCVVFG